MDLGLSWVIGLWFGQLAYQSQISKKLILNSKHFFSL
jgi:hypothetical protein